MASLDHGLKIIAQVSARGLARIGGLHCPILKAVESTIQTTTERLADRAFLARDGRERFVVYMEFITSWNESVPWSILEKSGMLAKRERLPVVSLVFILRPRRYRNQNGTIRLIAQGSPTQQVWFNEIRLWEMTPESWWATEPGLMAIYPLCRHQQSPSESILYASKQIEANESDSVKRADLLTTLGIFGGLAYPGLDALAIIGREKMKESRAYLEIFGEGEAFGEIKARRRDILEIVAKRFGSKARNGVRLTLNAIEDAEQLHGLLMLASTADSFDEVRQALNQQSRE